jgi:hypothetical protein
MPYRDHNAPTTLTPEVNQMSYMGVVIFERTDFPEGQVGNRFDTDPMVFLTETWETYSVARFAAGEKASECLRNGAMIQKEMGHNTDSMLAAADRILGVNNATYSFELPDGSMGEFLVRISIVQKEK